MSGKILKNDIVIIGGIHHNTLGVIRSFGERGFRKQNIYVCLVGSSNPHQNIISKSKYVSKSNILYPKTNADAIEYLINLAKDQNRRVIICCSDGSAEAIMRSYDLLKEWYELPSIQRDVSKLMEKQYQSELAQKVGFNIPQCSLIRKTDVEHWSIFPCITKPCKSIMGGVNMIFTYPIIKAS